MCLPEERIYFLTFSYISHVEYNGFGYIYDSVGSLPTYSRYSGRRKGKLIPISPGGTGGSMAVDVSF